MWAHPVRIIQAQNTSRFICCYVYDSLNHCLQLKLSKILNFNFKTCCMFTKKNGELYYTSWIKPTFFRKAFYGKKISVFNIWRRVWEWNNTMQLNR